jgi:hypothetical protein
MLSFELKEPETISVIIENAIGKTLEVVKDNVLLSGKVNIPISVELYSNGIYYVIVKGTKTFEAHTLFIIK